MVNRDWGFSSLRLAAAAILVIAAFAKVWHYPLILKGDGFLANQIVLDAAIVFEAIAAVAIVASGAKLCWWMIVSVYGLFTIVSAFALLTDSECNCFWCVVRRQRDNATGSGHPCRMRGSSNTKSKLASNITFQQQADSVWDFGTGCRAWSRDGWALSTANFFKG